MIELAMLPPIVQEYIKDAGAVELRMSNGQIIATPKRVERPFNFEIDELDKAINGKFATMPKGLAQDPEAFEKWLRETFV